MSYRVLAVAAASAALLSGCVTLTPNHFDAANSRVYSANRDVVWQRIIARTASKSMMVTQADQTNGLINAEREIVAPSNGGTVYDWADCGWGGVFQRPVSQRVDLNYAVRPEGAGAAVTVNSRFRELRQNMVTREVHWVDCVSTHVLENQMLQSFYYELAAR
jgi:hypothetical protein